MTCPCCQLPNCCPAFRAFDGSDVFYRYAVYYDWDIPLVDANGAYTLTEDDMIGQPARYEQRAPLFTQVTLPAKVDGHRVWDAVRLCSWPFDIPTTTPPPRWPHGGYGNLRTGNIPFGRTPERASSPSTITTFGNPTAVIAPWRRDTVFNFGATLSNRCPGCDTPESRERWAPVNTDFWWAFEPYDLQDQKTEPKSNFRLELYGRYAERPSPACVLNNPLP